MIVFDSGESSSSFNGRRSVSRSLARFTATSASESISGPSTFLAVVGPVAVSFQSPISFNGPTVTKDESDSMSDGFETATLDIFCRGDCNETFAAFVVTASVVTTPVGTDACNSPVVPENQPSELATMIGNAVRKARSLLSRLTLSARHLPFGRLTSAKTISPDKVFASECGGVLNCNCRACGISTLSRRI